MDRKLLSLIIAGLLLAALAFPFPRDAFAEAKTVRVVYFTDQPNFMAGAAPDAAKSGYGYEYLQTISRHTGWRYEYRYGNWDMGTKWLLDGDVDLMPDVSFTRDRASKILFPNFPMGVEQYNLYVLNGNTSIKEIPASLNGRRIGITTGTIQHAMFRQWTRSRGIKCDIVTYTDDCKKSQDLASGHLDAVIEPEREAKAGWRPLCYVGMTEYFLAVSKKRKDLLNELNSVLTKIHSSY